jgi:8-oxo-dGTP pyrophosphatase MutT (NUDIX family)
LNLEETANCPLFYSSTGIKYQDFTKRICALRELFEETNMLFAKEDGKTWRGIAFN